MDDVLNSQKSLEVIGQKAKEASFFLANAPSILKNKALESMAESLVINSETIIEANSADVRNAKEKGISGALIDRLALNKKRIEAMAEGLRQLVVLPDPVGEYVSMWKRPNGLQIGQVRVPLGVIGIIYEARPNVTSDAAGLCLKTGNAVILRGGKEAFNSNKAIVDILDSAAKACGLPDGCIQLVEDTTRETARLLMRLNNYIDVLIPRGGAGLIKTVVENSTIPVIETGTGNCHVYVDRDADLEMAEKIIINAKTSRPSVCNAAETLLVDAAIAEAFLPKALQSLVEMKVEIRGCDKTRAIFPNCKQAVEDDWYAEYLDYILAVKVVEDIDEAINHINKYGSKHSESIVTTSYDKSRKFTQKVDAAAVYVNASTRFTDGFEFGFGAEIGISTQKLHARGPMGLKELTTIKYVIFGDGQIRE